MGVEKQNNRMPDEFLQKSNEMDKLFAELGMPVTGLGQAAAGRHLEIVPSEEPAPRSREQQATEYFGQTIFPSPLRPAS